MTGLLNRGAWETLIDKQEQKCTMFGEPTAVIIIDLDGLKKVNDKQGHVAGDRYIRNAAKAIGDAARENDVIARLGGDEFGIFVESPIALDPSPVVDRLRRSFEDAGVSASIGWAVREPSANLAAAIQTADARMYENKRERKAGRA